MAILDKIPTFLTVGVLVFIFASLKRHAGSARLTLWAVGWFLVFIHFLAQLLEPAVGQITPWLLSIDLCSLQAAGIVFLVSVSSVVEEAGKRTVLLLVIGLPSVAYAGLSSYNVHERWAYIVCLATCLGGGVLFFIWAHQKFSAYLAIMAGLCGGAALWTIGAAMRGSFEEGMTGLLGLAFALPGVFICRNFWRASPGIFTITGGFFCWGAVFPIGLLIDRLAPNANIPGELWNTPKLFVAFGMILAVVEDKSESMARMQARTAALSLQLQRFSAITSRLLNGTGADSLCPEIVSAIGEVSSFRTAEIYVEDNEHRLELAAAFGATETHRSPGWSMDQIKSFCSEASRVGRNSFHVEQRALLIPLCSAGGGYLGCMKLGPCPDLESVAKDELQRIEALAADLAVAIELKALHRQLVWSEKLAALGQLVAGVAHELNNPLAVIMGYGEIMNDEIASARARDQLQKIVNESRRMKKIIENLLRFSRQSARETRAVRFNPIAQEVLALREHYLRIHNVHVELDVASDLPSLSINEDELRQILLNLLNNSIDALEAGRDEK